MGSKTLFNPVFNSPEQVERLLLGNSRTFSVVCLVRHVTHSSFFTVNSIDYNVLLEECFAVLEKLVEIVQFDPRLFIQVILRQNTTLSMKIYIAKQTTFN